jgi:superfamily II DNA/RNA helicase
MQDRMSFSELGLSPELLDAITKAGYSTPTPIQQKAIPQILLGQDITGIAQTGTGKTAAFVLPMIDRLARGRSRARMPRTLILAPTRELAAQVAENFEKYGINHKLTLALLIGGVSFGDQDRLLMKGVDVLIATPGRMIDQFERGKILLTGVEMLVIDEADRMLDMGFIPDIEKICGMIPPTRQTLLFSATMPPEITRLAKAFQRDPVRIEATRPAQTADTITQYALKIPVNDDKARRHALRALLRSREIKNGIVFCNRKREVDVVAKSLQSHGFDAAAIHGDLPQAYRTQTLDRFRAGDLKLLVASDVAARGLDIPDVGHVFNYAPPIHGEDYVHRIGRTGRAGRTGESFTIIGPGDDKAWTVILKLTGKAVQPMEIEGLAEELANLPRDEGGRSSRGRGGRNDRNDRGDRRNRGGRSGEGRPPRAEADTEVSADGEANQAPTRAPRPPRDAAPAAADSPEARGESRLSGRRDRSRAARRGERAETTQGDVPRAEAKPTRDREPRASAPPRRGDDRPIPGELPPAPETRTPGMGEFVPDFMKRR